LIITSFVELMRWEWFHEEPSIPEYSSAWLAEIVHTKYAINNTKKHMFTFCKTLKNSLYLRFRLLTNVRWSEVADDTVCARSSSMSSAWPSCSAFLHWLATLATEICSPGLISTVVWSRQLFIDFYNTSAR